MSTLSILPYFPFQRVRITKQSVFPDAEISQLTAVPDERFRPICHVCGNKAQRIYRHDKRSLRDLNLGSVRVWITCSYRKIACESCNRIVVEDLGFFQPYSRVTHRLAAYIHELCKVLTVTEVAKHFGINWKTVKTIDKFFLERQYAQTDYQNLRILAVDEISVKKGQRYLTVVLDYLSGRVVWVGKERTKETLGTFFAGMTQEQRQKLEAIAMDMWDPYIHAVKKHVPHVSICK